MTSPNVESKPAQNPQTDTKPNEKEFNFRNLEAKYEKMLAQERSAREQLEKQMQDMQSKSHSSDDDDDSEPYVDHKRLDRKLSSFEKRLDEKIEKKAEEKAKIMVEKEKRESWLRNNPDFYDILQHADKFAERDPELAETILNMPEGFERQKLVYKNIKALGIHKPTQKEPSIQEKVDANRRSPYYQPSGVGNAPYQSMGDFSQEGQKNSYKKMQELKSKLRI